jgi:uncharacterized repeat protein (TIGR03803 family)
MKLRICGLIALAAFVTMPGQPHAANLTPLVSFCAEANCADGAFPRAGLTADSDGNLFGTTDQGGAYGDGTVFEIAKTKSGYASTPTILYSFSGADGLTPDADLIADANGNLFGSTLNEGANGEGGTVFEITDSGFVPPRLFAGTPGKPNCRGQSVSALAQQYGDLAHAADILGYSSAVVLQNTIAEYCAA